MSMIAINSRHRVRGSKRHPSYYIKLNQRLAAEGRTTPPRAESTKRGLASLLKKWYRFCNETALDLDLQRSPPQANHFKTFLRWILDQYPDVRSANSLNVYWLQLKMHVVDKTCSHIDEDVRQDVLNYKQHLTKEYNLRKLARTKPVMGVDDLYHILFTHWVYDDATYADERQRVQVSAGILLASYTGCRPCSLFDTSQKKLNGDESTAPPSVHSSDDSEPSDDESSDDGDIDNDFDDNDILSESGSDGDGDDKDDHFATRPEETASIRYRDVKMFALRNSTGPNILAAKVTLVHTKGAERKSQSSVKTFVFEGENDPMFCVLDHLLALAVHDKAFKVEAFRTTPANIFHCEIPEHKNSLALRWRNRIMDKPIFRQPEKSAGAWGTSKIQPLKSSTWLRYLKRLGLNAGLEHSFTQYSIRRGLLNAVNGRAPDSVRNQIFDHASEAPTRWYLDQEVRFNTQAAFLERPSDGLVQKLARLMTLTADRNAPTKYSDKGLKKVANNRVVKQLAKRARCLTGELRGKYGSISDAPSSDPTTQDKAAADAALHALKENLRNKNFARKRRRHFRNADTLLLEAQFSDSVNPTSAVGDTPLVRPTKYNLPERGFVVRLICDQIADLTDRERLARRISTITQMAALCARQEAIHRRQPKATPNCVGLSDLLDALPELPKQSQEDCESEFPLVCRPTQCPICIGDKRKSYAERTREFARPGTMMDHVDTHLKKSNPNAPIPCHHPICIVEKVVLETLVAFKNHTARIHGINLRA